VDPHAYDWEGDTRLPPPVLPDHHLRDARRRILRAPQFRGFEKTRGTYGGLIEKIPYLQQLSITAVELCRCFQFDVQDAPPRTGQLLGICASLVLRAPSGYSSLKIRSAQ